MHRCQCACKRGGEDYDRGLGPSPLEEGHMLSRRKKFMLLTAIAGGAAMSNITAIAQIAAGTPPAAAEAGRESRFMVIQQLGLGDPTLKLTTAQRAQIDKTIRAYLVEQDIAAGQSATPARTATKSSAGQNQEVLAARRVAREQLADSVGQVLNNEQREIWHAAQATRQARIARQLPGSPRNPETATPK